jgi:hypothetical protein
MFFEFLAGTNHELMLENAIVGEDNLQGLTLHYVDALGSKRICSVIDKLMVLFTALGLPSMPHGFCSEFDEASMDLTVLDCGTCSRERATEPAPAVKRTITKKIKTFTVGTLKFTVVKQPYSGGKTNTHLGKILRIADLDLLLHQGSKAIRTRLQ